MRRRDPDGPWRLTAGGAPVALFPTVGAALRFLRDFEEALAGRGELDLVDRHGRSVWDWRFGVAGGQVQRN